MIREEALRMFDAEMGELIGRPLVYELSGPSD